MLENKSVLIVEDNPYVAIHLAMVVEDSNGRVVGPAGTVAEALALLSKYEVAAAILDCQLSDRDVTPVALHLVERGVPFIIYTGTGAPQELAEAHPALSVHAKPMQPEAVVAALIAEMDEPPVKIMA